ncbi:Septum formation initiator [Candidatus Omnitrophus magneticus]|uniref:Septum formation initiator n=1 Tax=Candidatus Omnitrophus magneticus TaxID=1609969 RepID=A0A0F0CKX0_9BACT|nr:Septum formation initiator [Candidatus Omnitrophus magneticus]
MVWKKITIVYSICLFACAVIIFMPGASELKRLQNENRDIVVRVKMLEEENEALKEEITKLEKDPSYIEQKAREKLGILKKNEFIYKKSNVKNN